MREWIDERGEIVERESKREKRVKNKEKRVKSVMG